MLSLRCIHTTFYVRLYLSNRKEILCVGERESGEGEAFALQRGLYVRQRVPQRLAAHVRQQGARAAHPPDRERDRLRQLSRLRQRALDTVHFQSDNGLLARRCALSSPTQDFRPFR